MRIIRRSRHLVLVVLLAVVAAACYETDPIEHGPLVMVDSASQGVEYYSNRDAGYSTLVAGTDSNGVAQQRSLWVFGDSPSWDTAGVPATGGWATNSASLTTVDGSGNPGVLSQEMVTTTKRKVDGSGSQLGVRRPRIFVRVGADTVPSETAHTFDPEQGDHAYCSGDRFHAEWPKGIVTLPDDDPRHETVVVFYQNLCPLLSDTTIDFGPLQGGVATFTWSADAPDAPPVATRLNDGLFERGTMYNFQAGALRQTFTYGSGPFVYDFAGETYLATVMCGSAGSCTLAHVAIDPGNPTAALASIADPAAWRYLSDEPAWEPFPVSGTSISCAPTPDDDCGSHPLAAAWAQATTDPSTQPMASPSIYFDGSNVTMLYSPTCMADEADASGHCPFPAPHHDAVVRTAFASGSGVLPFGAMDGPITFPLAPSCETGRGCRAPIFHPELNHGQSFAFSYYDEDALFDADAAEHPVQLFRYVDEVLTPITTDKGRILWARSCVDAFLYEDHDCVE